MNKKAAIQATYGVGITAGLGAVFFNWPVLIIPALVFVLWFGLYQIYK